MVAKYQSLGLSRRRRRIHSSTFNDGLGPCRLLAKANGISESLVKLTFSLPKGGNRGFPSEVPTVNGGQKRALFFRFKAPFMPTVTIGKRKGTSPQGDFAMVVLLSVDPNNYVHGAGDLSMKAELVGNGADSPVLGMKEMAYTGDLLMGNHASPRKGIGPAPRRPQKWQTTQPAASSPHATGVEFMAGSVSPASGAGGAVRFAQGETHREDLSVTLAPIRSGRAFKRRR